MHDIHPLANTQPSQTLKLRKLRCFWSVLHRLSCCFDEIKRKKILKTFLAYRMRYSTGKALKNQYSKTGSNDDQKISLPHSNANVSERQDFQFIINDWENCWKKIEVLAVCVIHTLLLFGYEKTIKVYNTLYVYLLASLLMQVVWTVEV